MRVYRIAMSSAPLSYFTPHFLVCCWAYTKIALYISISITMAIMGIIDINKCPSQPLIPIYLVVMGIYLLLYLAYNIYFTAKVSLSGNYKGK